MHTVEGLKCPLCGAPTENYICHDNPLHILKPEDVSDLEEGKISWGQLIHRMKIRRGKMVRGR